MKEIKSNPSKIINCYLVNTKEDIQVVSIAESKTVKLTEIAIMDRQSNGSFIVKDRIIGTYMNSKLISNDNNETSNGSTSSIKPSKELKTLKDIDEKMLQVDEYLDNIEN